MRIEFKTAQRGYVLSLERDMFGFYVLIRRWYGLSNRRGGMKREVFDNEQSALQAFGRVEKLRVRLGYRPSGAAADIPFEL